MHAVRLQTLDPEQTFRGLVIQSRESTQAFDPAAPFAGEFDNPGLDWRIWNCDSVSLRRVLKLTSV